MHTSGKVVIVEGLIGSGKSTLARELAPALTALGHDALVLMEPVKKNENPYLADYYAEAARWSFTMQVHLLAARYRMHQRAQWHAMMGGIAVVDRSLPGDTAFARLQKQMGLMSEREFDTYSALYHSMTASILWPAICLRVLAAPETCNKRIAARIEREEGRRCESAIDLDYLRGLEREIGHAIGVLQQQGTAVFNVVWDADRDSPELRRASVEALAERIVAVNPVDFFLETHRKKV